MVLFRRDKSTIVEQQPTQTTKSIDVDWVDLFTNRVFIANINIDNELIKQCLYNMAESTPGVFISNVHGYQTPRNIFGMEEIAELSDYVTNFAKGLDDRLEIDNMWGNINYKYAYNRMHVHPMAAFSGVYYVQAEDTFITFTDPRSGRVMLGNRVFDPSEFQMAHSIPVKTGMMILFPSWLSHEVPQNTSDVDRISIAWNYKT